MGSIEHKVTKKCWFCCKASKIKIKFVSLKENFVLWSKKHWQNQVTDFPKAVEDFELKFSWEKSAV